MSKTCIVISASSDIGIEICKNWKDKSWNVIGTYRKQNSEIRELKRTGKITFFPCDLSNNNSITNAVKNILHCISKWDVIIFCTGTLEPIGSFQDIDFNKFEQGIQINLLKQLRILHALLPFRNEKTLETSVIFFAGGGTNNSVKNYSSYTLSKVALIKMCELLDAEILDTRFVIIGPGWVKTKIHNETLRAGIENAKENYTKTLKKLESEDFVDIKKVVECCNWIIMTKAKEISGRNFSVEFDLWGKEKLQKELQNDEHMYKLRRYKNDWNN